jgi:hypothetical protein
MPDRCAAVLGVFEGSCAYELTLYRAHMAMSAAHRKALYGERLDRRRFIEQCERERSGVQSDPRAAGTYEDQIREAEDRIAEIDFLLAGDQDLERDRPASKQFLPALWDAGGFGPMSLRQRLRVWAIGAVIVFALFAIAATVILISQIT